jgi:hypothetical protein
LRYSALSITGRGNLLGRFSDGYKSRFDSKILGTEAETRFSNIILNRHSLAHGREINITFDELVESYHKANEVLNAIKEALCSVRVGAVRPSRTQLDSDRGVSSLLELFDQLNDIGRHRLRSYNFTPVSYFINVLHLSMRDGRISR